MSNEATAGWAPFGVAIVTGWRIARTPTCSMLSCLRSADDCTSGRKTESGAFIKCQESSLADDRRADVRVRWKRRWARHREGRRESSLVPVCRTACIFANRGAWRPQPFRLGVGYALDKVTKCTHSLQGNTR